MALLILRWLGPGYPRRAARSGGRVVISTVPLYATPRTWITGASVGSR